MLVDKEFIVKNTAESRSVFGPFSYEKDRVLHESEMTLNILKSKFDQNMDHYMNDDKSCKV